MYTQKGNVSLPVSIVVAGIIIAGAIIYTQKPATANVATVGNTDVAEDISANAKKVAPINAKDHVRGNRNAKVKIIEFSDVDCYFCAQAHPTFKSILDEYGNDVVWVYRHFPIVSNHPNAEIGSRAVECIAEQGGDDAFWEAVDALMAKQPSTDRVALVALATQVGVDKTKFEACLDSNKYADLIAEQGANGVEAGARGTPFSVILGPKGEAFAVSGAQPRAVFTAVIDSLLK